MNGENLCRRTTGGWGGPWYCRLQGGVLTCRGQKRNTWAIVQSSSVSWKTVDCSKRKLGISKQTATGKVHVGG